MSHRFLASLGASVIVIAVGLLWPVRVAGQTRAAEATATKPVTANTWIPPLTPYGQPDLQGVWLSNSATPLERPKALEGRPFLTDDEMTELKRRAARLFDANGKGDFAGGDNVFLAALENPDVFKNPNSTGGALEMIERDFENRTSLIINPLDGKIPALTPEAQQQAAARVASRRPPAGPEDLNNALRCITFAVPRLGGNFGVGIYGYNQIVQAPGYVVLIMEAIHDARVIPLDGRPHLPQGVRQWNGDSRGRWEGNTLVVDTTNFSPQSNFMGAAGNLHVIERFTRVAADTINYEITLDDQTTWTKPWTAVIRLKRTDDRIYEYACHEGNVHTMEGMLGAARADEKAAEEAAKGPR
jgi:hypothetical protein